MIFFFYGDEPYQPEQKVKDLTRRFLEKNPTGGGLEVCDWGEGCDMNSAQSLISAQNLFTQNKLIIIKDVFSHTKADEQKELRDILESRAGDDVVIIWERGNPRKNAALFTWLGKNAHTTKEYKKLEGSELSQWIVKYAKKENSSLSHEAVQTLILFVGSDLYKLSNEIEKLSVYALGREITNDDVHTLVEGRVDANIFDTVEALASQNKVAALAQFKKQILSGDDPHKILSMYAYQLRVLLAVSGEYNDGMQDQYAIAKSAKIHPFVAGKALAVVRRVELGRLLRAHKELVTIDRDIKRSNRDITVALEMFVMKF